MEAAACCLRAEASDSFLQDDTFHARTAMHSRASAAYDRFLFGPDAHVTQSSQGQAQVSEEVTAVREKVDSVAELSPASTNSSSYIPTFDLEARNLDDKQTASSSWRPVRPQSRHVWHPTLFQTRPLVGLVALAVTVLCTLASLAMLVASNDSPVGTWRIQPNVYLAIMTAVANTAIALAWKEAVPVRHLHEKAA